MQEAFALFDSDRDGEITVEELGKVSTVQDPDPTFQKERNRILEK